MYALQLLQKCAEKKGHNVLITATTRIAASLNENGPTLHSLLRLSIDEKDSSDSTASNSSKHGHRPDPAEVLYKADLIIVDESFMMDQSLFEMVDVEGKDL